MADPTPCDFRQHETDILPALGDSFQLQIDLDPLSQDTINIVRTPSNLSLSSLGTPFQSRGRGCPGISPESRYQAAVKVLREGKLGPADLILHVLGSDNPEGYCFRSGIYKAGGKLGPSWRESRKDLASRHSRGMRA